MGLSVRSSKQEDNDNETLEDKILDFNLKCIW